jgi:hypothetical protein
MEEKISALESILKNAGRIVLAGAAAFVIAGSAYAATWPAKFSREGFIPRGRIEAKQYEKFLVERQEKERIEAFEKEKAIFSERYSHMLRNGNIGNSLETLKDLKNKYNADTMPIKVAVIESAKRLNELRQAYMKPNGEINSPEFYSECNKLAQYYMKMVSGPETKTAKIEEAIVARQISPKPKYKAPEKQKQEKPEKKITEIYIAKAPNPKKGDYSVKVITETKLASPANKKSLAHAVNAVYTTPIFDEKKNKKSKDDYPVIPHEIAGYLIEASEEFGVSRTTIFAMADVESDFKHSAISNQLAYGVLQVQEATYNEIAKSYPGFPPWDEAKKNPRHLIRAGAAFYRDMVVKYNGNMTLALTAYCFGPDRLDKRIKGYGGIDGFWEKFPQEYPKVWKYHKDVESDREKYTDV